MFLNVAYTRICLHVCNSLHNSKDVRVFLFKLCKVFLTFWQLDVFFFCLFTRNKQVFFFLSPIR